VSGQRLIRYKNRPLKVTRQIALFGKAQENVITTETFMTGNDEGWLTVIAPNQPAICHDGQSTPSMAFLNLSSTISIRVKQKYYERAKR